MRRRAGRGRPGERLPLDRARHRHRVRQWDMPVVDEDHGSTNPKVFFGGDAAFGPKNIIWAVAHGHEAAISIDKLLQRRGHHRAAAAGVTLVSQKMGIHEWSYDNDISNDLRYKVPHARQGDRAEGHQAPRSNSASTSSWRSGGRALPELRRPDGVHRRRCASNATPASTSARWTASPSPRTATRPICARG
jgi:hypothetical protein